MTIYTYSLEEVMQILNASESTILRWRNKKLMPQPKKIGRRIVGWKADDFHEWYDAQ